MAQTTDDKVIYLATVELAKKSSFENCMNFLSDLKVLCYSYDVDIRQPATGAILSTEDKEGKTEY